MYTTKIGKAINFFNSGNYLKALPLYIDVANKIGYEFYNFNINYCMSKLDDTSLGKKTSNKNHINIVFICDSNYFMPTYIAIFSILENIVNNNMYHINIISHFLSYKQELLLKKLETQNIEINIYRSNKIFKNFEIIKKDFHVSVAAILKFEIPYILKHIDKALYLDSDIIVRKDISELFNINIDNKYAAVVKDMKPMLKYKPNILSKLHIKNHDGYFNSGMLLMNLKKMREEKIPEKLFEYRKHGINFFMDQDAFNVVFNNNVKYIHPCFNLLVTIFSEFTIKDITTYYYNNEKYTSKNDILLDTYILHFASKNKPWKDNTIQYAYIWHEYFLRSRYIENKKIEVSECYSDNDVIISLTSYKKRIDIVYYAIKSLLNQICKPKKIILWLAEDEFQQKESCLPNNLLSLKDDTFEICWCNNLKSYKKLIYSLKKYNDKIIVTADDDIIYNNNWLLELLSSYYANPSAIHCHRAHKILFDRDGNIFPYEMWIKDIKYYNTSFSIFPTGCGGVLYPRNSLFKEVFREEAFIKWCPTGDDIWFWGMAVLKGTKIQKVKESSFKLNFIESSQNVALWKENVIEKKNDAMLKNMLTFYPFIKKRIINF